ncbi:MAG TPA: SxtJ family membrane protein [Acidobacteriota bacterium]|nr:SxtJ family membrane protein [Acidobacteriota bacterium]
MTAVDTKRLRRFGLVVGLGLAVVAAVSWYRGHTLVPVALWSAGGALLLLGLVYPAVLSPVEKTWLKLGSLLAWVNTRIILSLLFVLVVTPIGALARLFRDPLSRRIDRRVETYWIPRTTGPVRPEIYERQF